MIKAVLFDYGRVLYGPVLPHRKVRGLAKDLRRHGIKTGILSNMFLAAGLFFKMIGGYRGFKPVILSSREKVAKPDSKIYQTAVDRLRVRPKEIIFVDDLRENVAAAEAAGMRAVLAKNSDQVVADIKQILLKENNLKL